MTQTDRDMVTLGALVGSAGDPDAEAAFQRITAELARLQSMENEPHDSATDAAMSDYPTGDL